MKYKTIYADPAWNESEGGGRLKEVQTDIIL